MKRKAIIHTLVVLSLFNFCNTTLSQDKAEEKRNLTGFQNLSGLPYKDLSHFSKVFGREKQYRIYLPEGYDNEEMKYPVIYFFHGWGGRHFKDDNALLEYEMIGDLVTKYGVILVMWDGNIEEEEPRPYNIGNHKDIKYKIQMKDYFPELVSYIDSEFRTLSDRNHRGIIGFSMGGIMSFYLAGKYPHMVSSAVNLAGSPEFFIGYPENHTLYPLRYTFCNLMQVNTRQHNGNTDILTYLNEEVRKGAEWEGNPYEYYKFEGGHMVDKPGETRAFEMAVKFITDNFRESTYMPPSWSHYDLYDSFEVWDYHVKSNKEVPGMLFLSDAGINGFGFYTHKWLPDGPCLDSISAEISTAPQYSPGKVYNLITWSARNSAVTPGKVTADSLGRITLSTDGYGHEFGIYDETAKPDFVVTRYWLNDLKRLLDTRQSVQLFLELFNRGGELTVRQPLEIHLSTPDSSVSLEQSSVQLILNSGQRLIQIPAFVISSNKLPPDHGEPSQLILHVDMKINDTVFSDKVIVPLLFDAPLFKDIQVDDGVQKGGSVFGKGNGNGIANAGEEILLYNGEQKLRLFTNDPWVDYNREKLIDKQIPAIWEDGFTMSSIIKIDENCPDGHIIEFTGCYETNTWNPIERNMHWGKVFLVVRNLKIQNNEDN